MIHAAGPTHDGNLFDGLPCHLIKAIELRRKYLVDTLPRVLTFAYRNQDSATGLTGILTHFSN
jgi:hypothetical protein